jgi:hypothetical protein
MAPAGWLISNGLLRRKPAWRRQPAESRRKAGGSINIEENENYRYNENGEAQWPVCGNQLYS